MGTNHQIRETCKCRLRTVANKKIGANETNYIHRSGSDQEQFEQEMGGSRAPGNHDSGVCKRIRGKLLQIIILLDS